MIFFGVWRAWSSWWWRGIYDVTFMYLLWYFWYISYVEWYSFQVGGGIVGSSSTIRRSNADDADNRDADDDEEWVRLVLRHIMTFEFYIYKIYMWFYCVVNEYYLSMRDVLWLWLYDEYCSILWIDGWNWMSIHLECECISWLILWYIVKYYHWIDVDTGYMCILSYGRLPEN